MSESFQKAVKAASLAMMGRPTLSATTVRAALRAALPHLTAEDVPHVAWEAWEEGYEVGYEDQRFRDTSKRRPPNPYDEETDHE